MINSKLMVGLTYFARLNLARGHPPIAACLTVDNAMIAFGWNKRFLLNDPTAHAEMICLRRPKVGMLKPADFRRAVLYTTLSPCWMCSGTILMLGIKIVVVGENTTFKGPEDILKSNGVQIFNLESLKCINLMRRFQKRYPGRWKRDISQL
ncbi:MAG: nucleoside deaminase [bacterium]|nr:nucleoside deaminase [bacterium]